MSKTLMDVFVVVIVIVLVIVTVVVLAIEKVQDPETRRQSWSPRSPGVHLPTAHFVPTSHLSSLLSLRSLLSRRDDRSHARGIRPAR